MRPVHRPRWHAAWQGHRSIDVALQALGAFCSACEQPLPQHGIAWDRDRWAPAPDKADADRWASVLPLCPMCADAADATSVSGVLLADRDTTFTLRDDSPLSYELRTLRVVRIDDRLEPVGEVERVVAVATDARAQATIDAFALNTPHYAHDDLLALPEGLDLAAVEFADPRLELRTAAWSDAHWYAAGLREADGETQRARLERSVTRLTQRSGFWSVWATVLWGELRDAALLARLLLPPPLTTAPDDTSAAETPHVFPATRAEALRTGAPDDGGA